MFDIEYEKTKSKNNYSSTYTVKQLKENLKKQILNKPTENILVKLFIDGKEINEENNYLGDIIQGDKATLYMACLDLTEDNLNNEKKIYENLIITLSKNCEIHKNQKALNICISCYNSICDLCISDHQNHKIISKKEIITYEDNLKENTVFIDKILLEIGVDTGIEKKLDYNNFHNYFRQDLGRQCENLFKFIHEIKKKEIQLYNKFKSELELIFPSILDYCDKTKDLFYDISENKKEKILRNEKDFIDFYMKYSQINKITEKSKQNILNLHNLLDKYKEIIKDFKCKTDLIENIISHNIENIRNYDISDENFIISPAKITKGNLIYNNSLSKMPNLNNINNLNSSNRSENLMKFISNTENDKNNIRLNTFNDINNHEYNNKMQNDEIFRESRFNSSINNNNTYSRLSLKNLFNSSVKNKNNLIRSCDKNINKNNTPKNSTNLYENTLNIKTVNSREINLLTKTPHKNKSVQFTNTEENNFSLINEENDNDFIHNEIFSLEISTRNIILFSSTQEKLIKRELDLSECPIKKFEPHHSTINYKNKFFISGGVGFYTANFFFILDQKNLKLIRLNDMLYKHPYHTLIGLNNNIFAISGFNSNKCEKYNITNKTWTNLADLNQHRSHPCCLFMENKFLYVFGGFIENIEKSNLSVERLNLCDMQKWEIFDVIKNDENITQIPFYCGTIRTSLEKIIIFGGKKNKETLGNNLVFNFDCEKNIIDENKEVKFLNFEEFQGKFFLRIDSGKYAQFSTINPNKLYIYDENSKVFEIKESILLKNEL